MKVLIVDDQIMSRRSAALALGGMHEVVEAADAAAAADALAHRGPFGVVVACRELAGVDAVLAEARRAPSAGVVVVATHPSADDAALALAAGARHYLAKPVAPALLRAAVASARPQAGHGGAALHDHGVQALTLNGYAVGPGLRCQVLKDGSAVHAFTVTQVVAGWTREVRVRVGAAAFRACGRPDLPAGGRLAATIARRALATHLCSEGVVPAGDELVLADVSPADVTEALREDAD